MKRQLLLCVPFLLLVTLQTFAADWWYFRRDGSREELQPGSQFLTIKFSFADPGQQYFQAIQAATALADSPPPTAVGPGFWRFSIEPGADLDDLIDVVLAYPEVLFVNPVFNLAGGKILMISDQIILRYKSGVSENEPVAHPERQRRVGISSFKCDCLAGPRFDFCLHELTPLRS